MDTEMLFKFITLVAVIFGASKISIDITVYHQNKRREKYKFAKQLQVDADSNRNMKHLLGYGYRALLGFDVVDVEFVDYLFLQDRSDILLDDYACGHQYLEAHNGESGVEITYAKGVKNQFIRRVKKFIFLIGGAISLIASIAPLLFWSSITTPLSEKLKGTFFCLFVFGGLTYFFLSFARSLQAAERLINNPAIPKKSK